MASKKIPIAFLILGLLIVAPATGDAHETHQYEINGVPYEIVIGSRNEPIVVDDKTGVDLEVVRSGKLLVGAQDALQVELIAGDTQRVQSFAPVYGAEGRYRSDYIVTVPTTISYRIFGTLEGTPFDVTYTCNPAGHTASVENTDRREISFGVVETLSRGNFGCPQAKETFGFPEEAPSGVSLKRITDNSQMEIRSGNENSPDTRKDTGAYLATLVLSASALLLSMAALRSARRNRQLPGIKIETNSGT